MRVPPDQPGTSVARRSIVRPILPGRQPRREPRQRRVEREDLGRPRDALEREDEREQELDVDVHRPARVAQDDDARLVERARPARERQHLAAGADGAPEAAPEIGQAAAPDGRQPAAPSRGPARGRAAPAAAPCPQDPGPSTPRTACAGGRHLGCSRACGLRSPAAASRPPGQPAGRRHAGRHDRAATARPSLGPGLRRAAPATGATALQNAVKSASKAARSRGRILNAI